jgi:hypothetical protein
MIKCLPSKYEALSSTTSTKKERERERKRERERERERRTCLGGRCVNPPSPHIPKCQKLLDP